MFKKKNSEYFSASFWHSHFMLKKNSLWISPKYFKTTEKHSLSVCGSLWGEKRFLLIFAPFTYLFKNSCLNKFKFTSGFAPFQTCYEKQTLWVFLCSFLREAVLDLKKKFSVNFPKNASKLQHCIVQQNVIHFSEKNSFFNICPILLVCSKTYV